MRPDLSVRVLTMVGRPGLRLERPPVRVRKTGPVIVTEDHQDATLVNLGYSW